MSNIDLNTRKPNNRSALALKSLSFDFTKEDAAPDLEFSEVIWKAVKRELSNMPAPRRAAFVKINDND